MGGSVLSLGGGFLYWSAVVFSLTFTFPLHVCHDLDDFDDLRFLSILGYCLFLESFNSFWFPFFWKWHGWCGFVFY